MKWETVKLGEVCDLKNGRAYKKKELLEKGKYPVLRVGAINMQACSYDAWVDNEYSRMASDIVDNLFD